MCTLFYIKINVEVITKMRSKLSELGFNFSAPASLEVFALEKFTPIPSMATTKPIYKGAMPGLLLNNFDEPFTPRLNNQAVPLSTRGNGPNI